MEDLLLESPKPMLNLPSTDVLNENDKLTNKKMSRDNNNNGNNKLTPQLKKLFKYLRELHSSKFDKYDEETKQRKIKSNPYTLEGDKREKSRAKNAVYNLKKKFRNMHKKSATTKQIKSSSTLALTSLSKSRRKNPKYIERDGVIKRLVPIGSKRKIRDLKLNPLLTSEDVNLKFCYVKMNVPSLWCSKCKKPCPRNHEVCSCGAILSVDEEILLTD